MARARRHQRLLSFLAFGLLALVAELVGRSLTHRVDIGGHVESPVSAGAGYYPVLLASVKLGIALLLTRLLWRVVRARSAERAAGRVLTTLGSRPSRAAPRLSLSLSPRLWVAFFALTSAIYLVQAHAEQTAATGRWPVLAPLLYSSALPIFASLSVLVALAWSAVQRWLAEYERYAEDAVDEARRLTRCPVSTSAFPVAVLAVPPRRLFGLAFESRPPPLGA
jgi:hypothetical protein